MTRLFDPDLYYACNHCGRSVNYDEYRNQMWFPDIVIDDLMDRHYCSLSCHASAEAQRLQRSLNVIASKTRES